MYVEQTPVPERALSRAGARPPPTSQPPSESPRPSGKTSSSRLNALCGKSTKPSPSSRPSNTATSEARRLAHADSHQFLHGGWMHLVFNMWFLWLTACNLEDRWGRLVFLPFYLASGIAGALAHRWFNAGSGTPMVGASGAIAGAMGGFLVIFASTPIRFFYLLWLGLRPKWGTFEARAIVMLPLWLLVEVLSGVFARGSGTAHWAHVGGFAFGAAVAGAVRVSGLDEKLDRRSRRARRPTKTRASCGRVRPSTPVVRRTPSSPSKPSSPSSRATWTLGSSSCGRLGPRRIRRSSRG